MPISQDYAEGLRRFKIGQIAWIRDEERNLLIVDPTNGFGQTGEI